MSLQFYLWYLLMGLILLTMAVASGYYWIAGLGSGMAVAGMTGTMVHMHRSQRSTTL